MEEQENNQSQNNQAVVFDTLVRPLLEKWEKRIVAIHKRHYRECMETQEYTKKSRELRGEMDATTQCLCEIQDLFPREV